MKRTVALVAGAAALGLAILGAQLRAQQQAQPLRTRVALLNLSAVIKNYAKYKAFEGEWQQLYQEYEKRYEGQRALLVQMQNDAARLTDQAQRDQKEAQIRNVQRNMQDMSEEAKKALGKKRDEQAVIIFREIEQAVQVFARANDIELVMHYNDAITPADLYSPGNVQRKLSTGACMPLYYNPQMDITQSIITMLNQHYQRMSQPVQQTGGSAPAQPPQPGRNP